MKTKIQYLFILLALSTLNLQPTTAFAQGTAFTYQGRLNVNGSPANNIYDLRFTIYDSASGGSVVSAPLTNSATAITNGLFTVTLDFGPGVFTGADRWLDLAVRTNGASTFTTLEPRQAITSTPYAVRSASATTAVNVSGLISASQLTGSISSNNIGAGSITTTMLAAGAVGANQLSLGAVTTGALADGAITMSKLYTATNWYPVTIENPMPVSGELFGDSVAVVGADRLLIGASGDSAGAPSSGAAYLFSLKGKLLATFTDPTPANYELFGKSLAVGGSDLVLIGAPYKNAGVDAAGAAYLFRTNGVLLAAITNPAPAEFANFGCSVALLGNDRVIAGASGSETTYLFDTHGTILATFANPTPEYGDEFGCSVASVGSDCILIGARRDSAGAPGAGAAYLFNTNGSLITTFTNPTPENYDEFGYSVASVGADRILVGAHHDSTSATSWTGAAYLFNTNGALLTTFTNPAAGSGEESGSSVVAAGVERIFVGASGGAGKAYCFDTNGVLINIFTNPTPANADSFGASLAAVGNHGLLVGAFGDNNYAGAAYLFSQDVYTPGLVADKIRSGTVTTESLEDGAVTASKISGLLLTNQIPGLDASKITSGTLADARLSPNVALLDANQVFTGQVGLVNPANTINGTFSGDGSALINLNASQLTGPISSNNIASGTITGAMLANGTVGSNQLAAGAVVAGTLADSAVTTSALADGVVTAEKLAMVVPAVVTLTNPISEDRDNFGSSVAAVGTGCVLIGASGSWFATNAGAAHLFSTEGTLLATFNKPADANGYGFGASVAAIGTDRVLIGAPYQSWDSELPGAAYLFSTNGALLTTYTNTMWWNSGDDFGSSVAAVGTDCVLIGAPYAYAGPINDAGAALLFSTNGTLITIFTNPAPTAFDRFGERVAAIGKDRVLIGAPGDDLGATNAGAVYLFNTNGALLTTFANPAPTTDDSFGWSLAVLGKDRVLIGAPGDDLGATNAGAVYLFNTNGALLTTFANPVPTTDDSFGWHVEALGTDYVLIGAPYKNAMAGGGIVYLFNTNGLLLNTFTNPIPDNYALFGCSIAAVGDYQVVIGASGADMGALDGGVAYLFDAISGEYVPGVIVDGVRSASINTRNLKDGAVTAAKLDSAIGVWTRSGQNVYRLEGNVGIGTNAPQSALHVVGTVVADSFSGNLSGNATTATIAGDFTGSLAGDVISTQHATVVSEVGGVSAGNIAAGANAANNATSTNTAGGIVKRDASGNFSAGTVTGTLSGYASGSLLMATNLSVSLTSLASASTGTWTKIGNVGSFTKQSGATIEVTYNGRLCVGSWGSGATGADFELRVDDTVVTSGRARATIVTTDSTAWGAPGTMTGIFTGLSAGSHTISIWVYGYSGSLSSVQVNPGGFNAAQVEVKEFK